MDWENPQMVRQAHHQRIPGDFEKAPTSQAGPIADPAEMCENNQGSDFGVAQSKRQEICPPHRRNRAVRYITVKGGHIMVEQAERLWTYDAVEPGQYGAETVVEITAENVARYAEVALNDDARYRDRRRRWPCRPWCSATPSCFARKSRRPTAS